MNAQTHETRAANHEAKARESFERSDTDGFVSQWAHGISAGLERAKAELARNGGKASFPGLFERATGERVKAKLISGRYGMCWAFVGEDGEFSGEFLGDKRTKRAKLYKVGYEVKDEMASAYAATRGSGTGLAGACSVYVGVFREDEGYPEGAKVV